MEIAYTPSYDESMAASSTAARSIFRFWQRHWCVPFYLILGIAVGFSFPAIWRFLAQHLDRVPAGFAALAICIAAYVVGIRILSSVARRLTAKWLRERQIERPTVFSVNADGLQWESGQSVMKLAFGDIDQIFESEPLVGFITGGVCLFVPKRAMRSPNQRLDLIRKVYDRLGDAAKKRSAKQASVRAAIG
jgi:hypothetical protein